MKRILASITLLLLLVGLTACGTLAPNGAYQGDDVLYKADTVITTSYTVFDSFLKYEHANRAALSGRPEIKKAADHIRTNAKVWIGSAIALRDAYALNPTPDGNAQLQKALAVLRAALIESTRYLSENQNLLSP